MTGTPIDHVVLPISDPDTAALRLRNEHGLEAASPSTFPELGLANRVIPLGNSQYLELLAAGDATAHPFAATVAALAARGVIGWCLAVEELESVAARIGLEATPMSLVQADGQRSSWRLVGLAQAMAAPWLPFFIAWDDPDQQCGACSTSPVRPTTTLLPSPSPGSRSAVMSSSYARGSAT